MADERPDIKDEAAERGYDENDPTVIQIARLNEHIDIEGTKWQKLGMHPMNIGVNVFMLDQTFFALLEYLEQLIPNFDPLEFEKRWKSRTLQKLIEVRRDYEKQKTLEDITAGIVDANGNPINVKGNG